MYQTCTPTPRLTKQLIKELERDGVDIEQAMKVSDARDLAPDEEVGPGADYYAPFELLTRI